MKSIVVFGDALAGSIAVVLGRLAGIHGQYRVIHVTPGTLVEPHLDTCAILLRQAPYEADWLSSQLPAGCTRTTFPSLELRRLWPFTCVNPFNWPATPSFPNGPFPYGDSFIVSCLEQHVDPGKIVDYYLSVEWDAGWPDLDALEQDELTRLKMLDAQADFGMASYISEHIAQRRLFWSISGPSNELLCELIVRTMERAFPAKTLTTRRVLSEVLRHFGDRDLFGSLGVPIHPYVAQHFSLAWYDPQALYPYFGEMLSYREYFERMVRESLVSAGAR